MGEITFRSPMYSFSASDNLSVIYRGHSVAAGTTFVDPVFCDMGTSMGFPQQQRDQESLVLMIDSATPSSHFESRQGGAEEVVHMSNAKSASNTLDRDACLTEGDEGEELKDPRKSKLQSTMLPSPKQHVDIAVGTGPSLMNRSRDAASILVCGTTIYLLTIFLFLMPQILMSHRFQINLTEEIPPADDVAPSHRFDRQDGLEDDHENAAALHEIPDHSDVSHMAEVVPASDDEFFEAAESIHLPDPESDPPNPADSDVPTRHAQVLRGAGKLPPVVVSSESNDVPSTEGKKAAGEEGKEIEKRKDGDVRRREQDSEDYGEVVVKRREDINEAVVSPAVIDTGKTSDGARGSLASTTDVSFEK